MSVIAALSPYGSTWGGEVGFLEHKSSLLILIKDYHVKCDVSFLKICHCIDTNYVNSSLASYKFIAVTIFELFMTVTHVYIV